MTALIKAGGGDGDRTGEGREEGLVTGLLRAGGGFTDEGK